MRLTRLILLSGLLLALAAGTTSAQEKTVLTLVVSGFEAEFFPEEVITDFEALYPNIDVVIKESRITDGLSQPQYDIDAHLEGIQSRAAEGDVFFLNSADLSIEATRTGYILDLRPLVSADAGLNPPDFYPALWSSVQWDNGVWGIPVSADVTTLSYLASAFDAAGVAYPDGNWTVTEYVNVINALAERDSSGAISLSGMVTFGRDGDSGLFRALLGQGVYDDSLLPSVPNFDDPALVAFLETWATLEENAYNGNITGSDFTRVPLRLAGSFAFGGFNGDGNDEPRQNALLANNASLLDVTLAVVSGGTAYPEEAYLLTSYLSTRKEVSDNFFGYTPARQSLVGVEASPEGDRPFRGGNNFSEEDRAFLDQALFSALPASELRWMNYVSYAAEQMKSSDLDAVSALQQAEALAIQNLETASNLRETETVFVATPVPTPVLGASEVSVRFGYQAFMNPLPNQADWDQAVADFVANDPQVGQLIFDTPFQTSMAEMTENYDCFVLPYNVTQGNDLAYLLNLDPFMSADPAFTPDDVVGNLMTQLQRDNKTWGMPMFIQPQVLRYHADKFLAAGAIPPETGWTIDQFTDALRQLKLASADDAPFVPQSFGATYLLMLTAAYGGIPLDYRTNPPTLNFTDPTTVTAIQEVLNLAKDGYIEYTELGGLEAVMIIRGGGDGEDLPAITDQVLDPMAIRRGGPNPEEEDPYFMTSFPTGSQYTPVSYNLGVGYISATTPYADACYRWLATISQQPSLWSSMPARRSTLAALVASGTEDAKVTSFYQQFDQLLTSPNTLSFPGIFGNTDSPSSFLLEYWLGNAFDAYVLEGADLATELEEQAIYAQAYLTCAAQIPPFDPLVYTDTQAYFEQYLDCAVSADPSMASFFPTN